ncbi:MAG: HupE/UreJ family protein [Verrucomicrobiales bacterium]
MLSRSAGRALVLIRLLFTSSCFLSDVHAHVVEQFYGEVQQTGSSWEIEILFDVGYAKPEWRGDPDTPAPTRDWLLKQAQEEHAALRQEAESFLRECLTFHHGEEPLEVTYEFPDFSTQPPDFPTLLTGGAYYRVRISPISSIRGPSRLGTSATDIPNFVLHFESSSFGEDGFVTVEPGESQPLTFSPPERPSDPDPAEHHSFPPRRPAITHALIEGFRHVIPLGLDHILFILTLFLLQRKGKELLWQSLCFTLAHTITLGLTASSTITPASHWIEPLIALSIAALAIENLFVKEFRPWRYAMIFGFGLIHGMGFAQALAPILVQGDGFLPRLIATNLGVEIAQVAILASAWVLTSFWHERNIYAGFRLTINALIAIVALYWVVERFS